MKTRLGDFGAGGPRSAYGDRHLNVEAEADRVASGEWSYWVHTRNRVAWHTEDDSRMLLLKREELGWALYRATRKVSRRYETLSDALQGAGEFMRADAD